MQYLWKDVLFSSTSFIYFSASFSEIPSLSIICFILNSLSAKRYTDVTSLLSLYIILAHLPIIMASLFSVIALTSFNDLSIGFVFPNPIAIPYKRLLIGTSLKKLLCSSACPSCFASSSNFFLSKSSMPSLLANILATSCPPQPHCLAIVIIIICLLSAPLQSSVGFLLNRISKLISY